MRFSTQKMAALLALVTLPACELWPYKDAAGNIQHPYTTLDPISDFGQYTHELYAMITYIVLAIFVVVSILMAYTLVRFRDDGSEDLPEQIHGNTQMEIGWTIAPIFIIIVLIVPTIQTVFKIADAAPQSVTVDGVEKKTVEINVIGKRWWWAFEYIESGVVTANQFRIPDDRYVSLSITSDTVIHSFWAPRIGGKRDAVPGRMNRIWFKLTELDLPAGEQELIRGECAEYCGEAHSRMLFDVVAMDGPDFDSWLEEMKTPATFADASVQSKGETAFTNGGCIGCHAIEGNDLALGIIGPNLTRFGDRKYAAAGIVDLYPDGSEDQEHARAMLRQWIVNPNSLKPGTTQSANASRALDGMNIPLDKNGDGILSDDEMSAGNFNVDDVVEYLLAMQTTTPLR